MNNISDLELEIFRTLENVTDPEMPYINVVELGMVEEVEIDDNQVFIKLLPTFSGCPALDMIKGDVLRKIKEEIKRWNASLDIEVKFSFNPPWTTKRISEEGRRKLKMNGIASPDSEHKHGHSWEIDCPYCDSTHVTMENIFGPTACRSILYCNECKNPFEAMKPVANLYEKVDL
ncbi:1,2-phenylacetyl-CoA epoxidase subunit PaaD [Oceanobacillus sp. J11TS1]|uniref:1,2-phenylacetyl-CoA epoxidase subunit PaaD n=1 Tax=Oceanobacillus sp. J11TS1 TaxID=2807191 RepID=UPI001B219749|nr:1,2-phenylacetyl-CoA epoxidase subunit PaaD [Oceanobacillus sp. J11TS1]GIO23630.1 phenylacetate-CoA oxygenase subunit PaaJ [Oceanobacillus sp. J11TS1]